MSHSIEDQIIETLKNCVVSMHANHTTGDRKWTTEFKKALILLGRKQGYKVCAGGSHHEECEPEWLYDLTWYVEDGEETSRRLVDLPLVVECEWNKHFNHIRGDFEKLLASNAQLRLMICQSQEGGKTSLWKYFEDSINTYKRCIKGDRFVIGILDTKLEEFEFKSFDK